MSQKYRHPKLTPERSEKRRIGMRAYLRDRRRADPDRRARATVRWMRERNRRRGYRRRRA